MLQLFGIISGILSTLCYLPYIRDTLRLKTKPERASWFIWAVLGGIAFFSQLSKGATDSLWLVATGTLGPAIVFFLSLRFGYGGMKKRDVIALLAAGIGLLLWYFTQDATIALLIVILVDAFGAMLTIMKAYEDPKSETRITWLLAGIAGFFALLAVGQWNFILLIYPLYIFIINFAVVLAMYLGEQRQGKKK